MPVGPPTASVRARGRRGRSGIQHADEGNAEHCVWMVQATRARQLADATLALASALIAHMMTTSKGHDERRARAMKVLSWAAVIAVAALVFLFALLALEGVGTY